MHFIKDPGQFFSTSPMSMYDFEACCLWNLPSKNLSISTRLDYKSKYFLLLSLPLNKISTSAGTFSLSTIAVKTNNSISKGKITKQSKVLWYEADGIKKNSVPRQ